MIIFVISLIILFIGFILWVDAKPDSARYTISIILMAISLVCGFLLFGIACPVTSKTEIIVPENVAKSEFVIFVKINGETLSENNAKIVAAPVNRIRVKKISDYNSYGFLLKNRYSITLSD